ncbi:hypothetical protein PG993_002911 [Apiospora rasikravindrae]|uniref:Uncharacterized protein n=1 Tax=Apiospora rasikravindrae TaxID=990691 RepID=A0ABR1TXZ4_9PEZI
MQIIRWALLTWSVSYAQVTLAPTATKTHQGDVATIKAKAMSTIAPEPDRDPRLCGYINGNAGRALQIHANESRMLVSLAPPSFPKIHHKRLNRTRIGNRLLIRCVILSGIYSFHSSMPACVTLKYTDLQGYHIYQCGQYGDPGDLIARNATTSPSGGITNILTVMLPTSVPTPTPTPDSPGAPGDQGLSLSDKIALGCGIGIGLPVTVTAIYSCIIAYRDRRRRYNPLEAQPLQND